MTLLDWNVVGVRAGLENARQLRHKFRNMKAWEPPKPEPVKVAPPLVAPAVEPPRKPLVAIVAPYWRARRIRIVIKEVAAYYGTTSDAILHPSRQKPVADYRHVAMYLVRKRFPELSYPEVVRHFNRKDHTTVLHACMKIGRLVRRDPKWAADIESIECRLRSQNSHAPGSPQSPRADELGESGGGS